MRNIIDYINDCFDGGNYATPMNTAGMGNITAPEGNMVGSGDIPQGNIKIRKKKKRGERKNKV